MSTSTNWTRLAPGTCPPYSVYQLPIQKSEQDDRSYQVIKLSNGLEATLVHDGTADKAAASLDVAVGHLSDPDDMPGLAHFCEHLLFMGTTTFPKENEYAEYLARHNGSSNAFTSTTNTNYFFNVSTDGLPGALERFSAFFHCPSFAPSCTSRELSAVDSEHKKNHQSDIWRMFQLNKHLTQPGHVWNKFGSGSRESLTKAARDNKAKGLRKTTINNANKQQFGVVAGSVHPSRTASPAPSVASTSREAEPDGGAIGRETRRRLIEWWEQEYCARRMRLCVIGKESLLELAELTSKLFSGIPDRGKDALFITEHPFGANEKNTLVMAQTVMDFRAMEISFPLEYQPPYWRHKPANLLSHLLGHEGVGSLLSYLKRRGWVTGLSSGPQNLARSFAMFKATIHLTSSGFEHYNDVILAVFKYLSLLRTSELEPYHQHESAMLSSIRFRFAEKRRPENYATWITEHMPWPIPRELLLAGPQLTWDWDNSEESKLAQAKIKEYLEFFRIQNCRVFLMAKGEQLEKLDPNVKWSEEPWYGTRYSVSKFDEAFVAQAEAPNDISELTLPAPNEFIPKNFDVDRKDVAQPAKRPRLIPQTQAQAQTQFSALWHKKDDQFWVPKAHFLADLRSPVCIESPRSSVLTRLYLDLVIDSLTEASYEADLAGLSYNLIAQPSGFIMSVQGYNDKLELLVKLVQERLRTLIVQADRFAVIKELVEQDWKNFFLGQSYSLSEFYARYALADRQWLIEERLSELAFVTPKDVEIHIGRMVQSVSLRMLAAGNISEQEAIQLRQIMEEGFTPSPLPMVEHNDRALLLPEGGNFTWTSAAPNPNQANSALTYYVHCGSVVVQEQRVISSLLIRILSEPAFNILRTKEQLGYIVQCNSLLSYGSTQRGMRILVQSEKNPGYLEERVEAFLNEMKQTLINMPLDDFNKHKASLGSKWSEADKNLAEETARYMTHITTGHHDFFREYSDAEFLKSITKDDVLEFFKQRIDASSPLRSKLSIHVRSIKPRPRGLSAQAAAAYEDYLQQKLTNLDPITWENSPLRKDPLSLPEFVTYWTEVLASEPAAENLLAALGPFVEKYPIPGEGEDHLPNGVTEIKNFVAFKSKLVQAQNVGPLVLWDEGLPRPKF